MATKSVTVYNSPNSNLSLETKAVYVKNFRNQSRWLG
jgi:hypothetical protein